MSSNVHALEGIRPLRAEIDRPDRSKLLFEPLFDGPAMIQNRKA
jgi:hypothetical protein